MMNILELESRPLADLRALAAREFEIPNANRLKKEALVLRLRRAGIPVGLAGTKELPQGRIE